MPKVKALVDVPFGVGIQPKGAVFDATEQEASLLVALKRVERVKDAPAPPPAKVEAKVLDEAEPAEPANKAPSKNARQTRQIKTRD